MNRTLLPRLALVSAVAGLAGTGAAFGQTSLDSTNPSGIQRTITSNGVQLNTSNAFFRAIGTNGRSCASCHVATAGWSINPTELQARFNATGGLDPVFRTIDGSNSPLANVSTVTARRSAYSMLLNKGLIRIQLAPPPIPITEYTITGVQDPYNYANASRLSLFRRPMPATNLRFLSAVMWDGRDSFVPTGAFPLVLTTNTAQNELNLFLNLVRQANNAIVAHNQPNQSTATEVLNDIVNFQGNTVTAQISDSAAGRLDQLGASGGPVGIVNTPFYFGINDVIGRDPFGVPFSPNSMTMYNAWIGTANPARAAIARGAQVFNFRTFNITGVNGLNDPPALNIPVLRASCVACHDSPNIGTQSTDLFFDTGVADGSRRTSDLPLYTLRNNTTGAVRQVTDPGRALVTGRWADIGKFKPPGLRSLAARPPYFHNGSARDIPAVVEFYNSRFSIGYTAQEKADLIAFLKAL